MRGWALLVWLPCVRTQPFIVPDTEWPPPPPPLPPLHAADLHETLSRLGVAVDALAAKEELVALLQEEAPEAWSAFQHTGYDGHAVPLQRVGMGQLESESESVRESEREREREREARCHAGASVRAFRHNIARARGRNNH